MEGPILLFDGECGLCSNAIRLVLKCEKEDALLFVSLQSNKGIKILESHPSLLGVDTVVLLEEGVLYIKSSALVRIARYFRFPYNLLGVFWIIPRFIRNWIYDWVARNRHKIFAQQCLLPTKDVAQRFIN